MSCVGFEDEGEGDVAGVEGEFVGTHQGFVHFVGELLGIHGLSLYSPLYSTAKWESVYIEKIEIGTGNGDWNFLDLKMELMDLPHNFNTTLTPTTKSDLENGFP